MSDAKQLTSRLKKRARLYEALAEDLQGVGGLKANEIAATWQESADDIYEAAARIEAMEAQVAAERERCAKIADGIKADDLDAGGFLSNEGDFAYRMGVDDAGEAIAAAIRAGDGP